MRSIVQCNPGEGPQLMRGTVTPHPDRISRCDPTSPFGRGEHATTIEPDVILFQARPVTADRRSIIAVAAEVPIAVAIAAAGVVPIVRFGQAQYAIDRADGATDA